MLLISTSQVGPRESGRTISVARRTTKDRHTPARRLDLLRQQVQAPVVARVGLYTNGAYAAALRAIAKCVIEELVNVCQRVDAWPEELTDLHPAVGANVKVYVLAARPGAKERTNLALVVRNNLAVQLAKRLMRRRRVCAFAARRVWSRGLESGCLQSPTLFFVGVLVLLKPRP